MQGMMDALSLDGSARDGLYTVPAWRATQILCDVLKDRNISNPSSFIAAATAGEASADTWNRPHKRSCHGWDEAGMGWSQPQQPHSMGCDNLQEPQDVESLVKEREIARRKKDFGKADRIRKILLGMGVTCNDKTGEWFSANGRMGLMPTWATLNAEEAAQAEQNQPPPPPPPPPQSQGEDEARQTLGEEVGPSQEQLVLQLKGVPWQASAADVCEFLQDYGVQEPQVKMSHRSDGKPDGIALVTFASSALAARALEERQYKYLGHRFIVLQPYSCTANGI